MSASEMREKRLGRRHLPGSNSARRTLAAGLVMVAAATLLHGCATTKAPDVEPMSATSGEKMYQNGNRWYLRGCYQEALRYYFGAYEFFCAGDRLAPAARALNSIGNLYRRLGDPETALTFYNEALEIDHRLTDTVGQAQTLINRSAAQLDRHHPKQAAADLRQAESLAQGVPRLALALSRSRGILATRSGHLQTAETHLREALERVGDTRSLESAATHYAMGKLRLAQLRPEEARAFFTRALELDRELGHTHGLADDLEALGDCDRELQAWSQAAFLYQRSVRIFALLDHTDKIRQLLETLQTLKEDHPDAVNADLTLFFIDRWVDGQREADICP
jgi:tetratricopeptide (TPR) repeat protein